MDKPTITVVHRLSNRVRIKLSWPVRDVEKIKAFALDHEGIQSIEYAPITRTTLIYFDPFLIDFQEVLIRIAIGYSRQYGMLPVRILTHKPIRDMSELVYYSGFFILAAFGAQTAKPNNNIQELLNWLAVGTTTGAIVEHAWTEVYKKGMFDPEVVSLAYLINSVFKGNFVTAAALTWITTFGRHLFSISNEGVELRVFEIKDKQSQQFYYDISVLPYEKISNITEFLKAILIKYIEKQGGMGRNALFKERYRLSKSV